MNDLLKIRLKPLVMLLFIMVILSTNIITTFNQISENASESIILTKLHGNLIETLQDSEKTTLSDVQISNNVSEPDTTKISSNRNELKLSNDELEVILEDGSIITSLGSIYENLDISTSEQEINKLIKVTDSKVEVIAGFLPAHRFSYGSYGYHLHKSKAQLKRELPKLNAIVLEVPISSLKTFMSYWQTLEIVRYVEVAQVTSVSAVVNDLNWSLQYGAQIIQADLAWDIQIGNPESILVAVIDTGVDYNHPDLVDQYVTGGYDYVNDDNDPMDDHSHGTHCAGVIGATINNSIGIAGITNVSIMAIKVFDSGGYGNDYDAASAIIDATDAGADVLSNSYGFPSSSTALEDAVTYASANDVVIVVAAGNDASPVSSYPALYPETIVVSATDDRDTPASFTNYGSAVDVAAPGVNIWSTIPVSMGSYGYMSGTSMACPHAAAVCALIRAEFPDFSADEVRQQLNASVDDLGLVGRDDYYGYGRVNAFRAVQLPPEHELVTYLFDAPSAMLPNEMVVLKAVVYNDGQNTEMDVDLQLWIDDIKVENQTLTSLAVGENGTIEYSWTPTVLSIYNITVYTIPVISELFEYNNKITKMVKVTLPIITYNLGDFAQLHQGDDTLWANFTYLSNIDTTHVHVDFGDGLSWVSVNTLTRQIEDGSLWIGTFYPGQIETDISIGDTINWLSTTGIVESTVYYDWNGMILEAWNISIELGAAFNYYHKETGIWLYYQDVTGFKLFMNDTNMINWQQSEHEVQVILETPAFLAPGESTLLNASVHNRGTSEETNVILQLWIEDSLEYYEIYTSLLSGAIENISYPWIPTEIGKYNITAYVVPVPEEQYLINNAKTKIVGVAISSLLSDFEGSLSDWTWDGLWQPINDSQAYGEVYSPVHSMYYGQNETGNYNNGSANKGTLMTPWYALGPDVISLNFWSWYETEELEHLWDLKDVYLVTSEDIWIPIGYVSGEMNTWVQFFFDISTYAGQIVRFAFVFDTIDEISNDYRGWYIDDVTILGTVNAPVVTVTYPNGGEVLSGTITVTWDASDLDGDSLTYSIYYWNGSAWIELTSGWTTTSYDWDTTTISDGEFYRLRVIANDGDLIGEDESDGSFIVDNGSNSTRSNTTATTTTTTSTETPSGFEVVLAILTPLFVGLVIILIRKRYG
jgi:thermitase